MTHGKKTIFIDKSIMSHNVVKSSKRYKVKSSIRGFWKRKKDVVQEPVNAEEKNNEVSQKKLYYRGSYYKILTVLFLYVM